ncbi:MAG: hypothetical protein WBZ05_14615 [Desulfobacterales bacterium]
MKKINILFSSLAIIVIATASFQSIAMAAQVTRINEKKGFIFIDGSISDGFVMGANVCFYSSSGEEITCGQVEQTSESFARVKINNRIANQIRYGMEARLSVEKESQEEKTGPQTCTDDSECGNTGFCFNGKCQQR